MEGALAHVRGEVKAKVFETDENGGPKLFELELGSALLADFGEVVGELPNEPNGDEANVLLSGLAPELFDEGQETLGCFRV